MKLFICETCGHVAFNEKPEQCPACGTYLFQQNDTVFSDSEAKSKEAGVKHVPAITVNTSCGFIPENECMDIMVRIGEKLHPMEEKHFIQFIDCYLDNKFVGRAAFSPALNPAACFHIKEKGNEVTIVEQCTVHGYWMAKKSIL